MRHSESFYKTIHQQKKGRVDYKIQFNEEPEHHYLPISVIKGEENGKTFTIVSGIHGYEYPPIISVQEVLNEIEISSLKGTLIILPIANVASFYKRTPFVHPTDQKNLNYIFPGSKSGSITEQLAHWITQNIIPISDVFLDIHGGDANEDLIPFVCYYDNKNNVENTKIAHQLSEVSDFPYIVSYPYLISETEPALYAFKQAVQNGKIALSLEAGKLGNLQKENVSIIKSAIYNMLSFMNIYSKPISQNTENKIFLTQQEYIKVSQNGIFYSDYKSGDLIQKGNKLGFITDEFGNILEEIFAPCNGTILYKIGTPPVNKGETLFCIAY